MRTTLEKMTVLAGVLCVVSTLSACNQWKTDIKPSARASKWEKLGESGLGGTVYLDPSSTTKDGDTRKAIVLFDSAQPASDPDIGKGAEFLSMKNHISVDCKERKHSSDRSEAFAGHMAEGELVGQEGQQKAKEAKPGTVSALLVDSVCSAPVTSGLNLAETIKAAEQGDAKAQFNLGMAYEDGRGISRDYQQAAIWYRKAAEQGHAKAQYYLAGAYAKGQGVAQDMEQSIAWCRKAAEQGLASAQTLLAVAYSRGEGVPKDGQQAMSWYRKAAEQGYGPAQSYLGAMLVNGIGVAKDYEQAVLWNGRAAEQGDPHAQYNLALAYSRGQGVTKDLVQAHKWFNLSSAHNFNNGEAAKKRDEIEPQMTPEQIQQARTMAKEWKPTRK